MSAVAAPQRRATWHDAFDAQMSLWRWVRSDRGSRWLGTSYRMAVEGFGSDDFREMTQKLYAAEESKLLSADPIFVSAEMCDVIDAARGTFEPEPLYPTDLISTHGFLYFERPFEVLDRYDKPMMIAAFSWAPVLGDSSRAAEMKDSDDPLGWLQARDYSTVWKKSDDELAGDDTVDGIAITIYTTTEDATRERYPGEAFPAVLPMHFTPWWFGMTFGGNDVDIQGRPTGAGWWWKIAQTSLRLMQQRIAVRHQERPDRGTRRGAVRRGFDERDVVVVRLRREKGEPNEGIGADANYSHRFIVSGHWRNQWYPSGAVHRQIWISPYIKGDESLPLVIRPRRVFTWNR